MFFFERMTTAFLNKNCKSHTILIVSVVKILGGTKEGESVFAKFTIIIVNACYICQGILNI